MIHKNKSRLSQLLTTLALTTLLAASAWADDQPIQADPFILQSGGSGDGCPGIYTGYAMMTNSIGTFWITPPTNATCGTLTNITVNPPPFVSVACVANKKSQTWCGTNSITFPATNSTKYQLTVYVKSTPPPTNGQPMSMQIIWQ